MSWRDQVVTRLDVPWDVIVVGGGITGAGILLEASRLGLRALLLEQGDFASGTSSRSSKLVHGGLRYIAQGEFRLTWESVRERDRLANELPGLVNDVGFLLAAYKGDRLGLRTLGAGLRLYDFFSTGMRHKLLSVADLVMLAPRLRLDALTGGFWYRDASTDDARLVLRVLAEALAAGAEALSYARVEELLRDGEVRGVAVRDLHTGQVHRLTAQVVVNATGAWADQLRAQVGGSPVIRPLRGSHLLFPPWRFPVAQAVTLRHPVDGRPLFAYPWEGLTLLGTTDVDHDRPLDEEPHISRAEAAYLIEGARAAFPSVVLSAADALSTFSGVRPVIGTGQKDPSKESREHALWDEAGLVTVTGGKLTTFRHIARDTIRALARRFPQLKKIPSGASRFDAVRPLPPALGFDVPTGRRLLGRYGPRAAPLVGAAQPGELSRVPDTQVLWAELRWAARSERVVHLEDLLSRRVRFGLLLPEGGAEHLPRIRSICQAELGWDDQRWEVEEAAYREAWTRKHRVTSAIAPERPSGPRPTHVPPASTPPPPQPP